MMIKVQHEGQNYRADLGQPYDLSIPLGDVKCFYAPEVVLEPFQEGDFIGSVRAGAPVNFFNVSLNPHGNGTHTECLGHITTKQESVIDQVQTFHFIAELISVSPQNTTGEDWVITKEAIISASPDQFPEALIIRSLPNDTTKLTRDYSGTNPPYLSKEAMQYLVDKGVRHLLIDLPSVDRESDGGKLAGHHIFWNLDRTDHKESREDCTITELIYVDDSVKNGLYLLNLQMAPLKLDASPSKPVIFKLNKE